MTDERVFGRNLWYTLAGGYFPPDWHESADLRNENGDPESWRCGVWADGSRDCAGERAIWIHDCCARGQSGAGRKRDQKRREESGTAGKEGRDYRSRERRNSWPAERDHVAAGSEGLSHGPREHHLTIARQARAVDIARRRSLR